MPKDGHPLTPRWGTQLSGQPRTKPLRQASGPSPLQSSIPIPPPPRPRSHRAVGIGPRGRKKKKKKKKTAQFVMSCPAVNLPLPSHREDLLSSIYLFATWTMEGPRPAELFIIKPPTIPSPPALPLQPAAPAELQVSAGINPCLAPGPIEKGPRRGGSRRGTPGLGGPQGLTHVEGCAQRGSGGKGQPITIAPESLLRCFGDV